MIAREEPPFRLFHQWLVLAVLIGFGGYLAWQSGIYGYVVQNDPTRLSVVITALFVAGMIHCGVLGWKLAQESDALARILALDADPLLWRSGPPVVRDSVPGAYFHALSRRLGDARGVSAGDYAQLTDVLADRIRGQHEGGWFVTNALVKLGLLGTVIGFILMLRSVMSIDSFDISEAQGLLGAMTVGMGVALNTTMLGLVCSMLLGVQYLMMDRGADKLISDAVLYAESELIPAFGGGDHGV